MNWIEFRIVTTGEAVDALSEALNEIGAGGVAIEDPYDIIRYKDDENNWDYADESLLNPTTDEVVVKAYFPADSNIPGIEDAIKAKLAVISEFLNTGKGSVEKNAVAEEDWATSWKKYYKPLRIGENIIIKPTWEEYNPQEGDIVIEMDPGMAFGTGTHETTKMCSIFMEKYLGDSKQLLDIGCGTGILSIVGAKLGAEYVRAVDIDELAVKVTAENAHLNGVDGRIEVSKGVLADLPPVKMDFIVANIIANVIIDISEKLQYYLKAGGFFVASGIIKDREKDVLEAYSKQKYILIDRNVMGEWVAMVFKCPDFSCMM